MNCSNRSPFITFVIVLLQCKWNVITGSDDVNPLEAVVEQLSQKVDQLEAKLTSYENLLQKLQPSVAFSVQHSGYTFNISSHAPVLFDDVLINRGNGYSARHGEFTAPVSGLYCISFRGWSWAKQTGYLQLYFNDHLISSLPVGDEDHEDAESQSLLLHLQKGDVLFTAGYTDIEMMGIHRTTFMGYLLEAD